MLLTSPPPPELLRSGRFYQGCGDIIKGTAMDRVAFLNRIESSSRGSNKPGISRLTHIVEPKSDGIWVALVGNDNGDVWVLTKTGTHKKPDDMGGLKLLPNTIIVGELAEGSQQSTDDVKQHGCKFVKVFDVLKANGNDITLLTLLNRKAVLNAVLKELASKGGYWADGLKHIVKMPMWCTKLVQRYNAEPEGLVAKEITDGPYVCGSRNKAWTKVKKAFSNDYIITDWKKSTAVTKVSRSIYGMAESITVAGWVPDFAVKANDEVLGRLTVHTMPCSLVNLMSVGSMTDDMALDVAANFDRWKGKVIRIGHYKLFTSGAARHPFILSDEHGLAMLAECEHTECVYRLADSMGGTEI